MNRILLFAFSMILISGRLRAQTKDLKQASVVSYSSETSDKAGSKNVVIRLYPNPSYGKISVSTNAEGPFHFYIFDLEGTLIYQAILTNKEKKNIENLKKGTYLYDVFENDESIEEGKIIIK